MKMLVEYGFSPRAYLAPSDLYAYLQVQRRGFDMYTVGNEDPKIHDRISRYQRGLLAHLLHPTVLKRMTDSRLMEIIISLLRCCPIYPRESSGKT